MSTERDIIIERLEQKLAARDKEIANMQESIIAEMEKRFADRLKLHESSLDESSLRECENRLEKIEHRLRELNSSYDGVMKELLDQKSIIQELTSKKVKEEPKKEVKPKEEAKVEKQKPKGEYIVAGNYIPKSMKKQQPIIEAEDTPIVAEPTKEIKKQVKKSEKAMEGVEIVETLKRGK